MYIGVVIREIRKQKGLTQLELSDKTTISSRTIQRIENDAVEPSLYSLKRISEVLELDLVKIKSKNSMIFINRLLGMDLNEESMTTQEQMSIEQRLLTIESHLISIDRTYRKNRKMLKGVLIATGIISISILASWIIWMITTG